MTEPKKEIMNFVDDETWQKIGQEIAKDPDRYKKLLELVAEVNPDVAIPELHLRKEIDETKKKLKEEIDNIKQELIKEKTQNRWKQEIEALMEQGYSTSEIEEMIKTYINTGRVSNLSDAARLYEISRAPAEPTMPEIATPFTPPAYEGLDKNPKNWAKNEAYKAIYDFKKMTNRR